MMQSPTTLQEDASSERSTAEVRAALNADWPAALSPPNSTLNVRKTGPVSELDTEQMLLDQNGLPIMKPVTSVAKSQGDSGDILPESEFTYIDRPWEHFTGRWGAIEKQLRRCFGESPFTMVDLGSCSGYFSLQTAANFPASNVVGIEGSVGIGNGTAGVTGSSGKQGIMETKAVQTHVRWIERLGLGNCHVGVEVWDFSRVDELASIGRPICDVILMLSVVHHIDGISAEMYAAQGLTKVQGTVLLFSRLMELAPRVIIELPDRPWIEHIHDAYGTQRKILEAAAQNTRADWKFTGPLFLAEWYGQRELWLLERVSPAQKPAIPAQGLRSLFPCLLGPQGKTLSQAGARELQFSTKSAPGAPAGAARRAADVPRQNTPQQYTSAHPAVAALPPADPLMGELLCSAPTELLAAHFNLRTALEEAEALLHEVKISGYSGNQVRQRASSQGSGNMPAQGQSLGGAPQVQPVAAC